MIDAAGIYLVYSYKALFLLFVAYAALFTLQRILRRSGIDQWPLTRHLARLVFGLFLVADWWVNIVISPLMLDLPAHPRELVTDRLRRYKELYSRLHHSRMTWPRRWRLSVARFACRQLNQYDPDHC